jgi:hypothetical protein
VRASLIPWKRFESDYEKDFSLGRVMAKLANTTKTILRIAFIAVNLERILFFKK